MKFWVEESIDWNALEAVDEPLNDSERTIQANCAEH